MTRVSTVQGLIEGVRRDAHWVFRGVPYARPPIGSRRFRAPEPPEPWTGVRSGREFGPSASQRPPALQINSVPEPRNEDCLYLNVYTPQADARRRPVLFWIHGGGFHFGAGSEPLYDGGPLTERGDVVVVTINYRLGALGFLHLPDADRKRLDAPANLGCLDQIAALRWVRDNITGFGGDPDNVTVMGESAGAYSVATLLGMPAAFGLFRRAVAQSGVRFLRIGGDPTQSARMLLDVLEIPNTRPEALWDVPAEKLLDAQAIVAERRDASMPGVSAFAPGFDGDTLPLPLEEAFATGAYAKVPLLAGTTRDEINLFLGARLKKLGEPMDESELVHELRTVAVGADDTQIGALITTYRASRTRHALPHGNRALLAAITSDAVFRVPTERFLDAYRRNQPQVFAYLFTYESPSMRGAMRACHALDLPFMFGTYGQPGQDRFAGTGPSVETLSARMMDAWLAFAKSGDPSLPQVSGGEWPVYEPERRATMVFDVKSGLELAPYDEERAVWVGLTPRAMIQ